MLSTLSALLVRGPIRMAWCISAWRGLDSRSAVRKSVCAPRFLPSVAVMPVCVPPYASTPEPTYAGRSASFAGLDADRSSRCVAGGEPAGAVPVGAAQVSSLEFRAGEIDTFEIRAGDCGVAKEGEAK